MVAGMTTSYVSSAALVTALAVAGCAAPMSGTVQLPVVSNAAARSTPPVFRAFTAGKAPGFPRGAAALDITLGPDGAMWFTDPGTPAIGKIGPGGRVTEFTAGLSFGAKPYSIVAGPDGNLWFSDTAGAIGRITPHGTIVEFPIAALAGSSRTPQPAGIAAAGQGIWSIVPGSPSTLVRADLDGKLTTFKVPPNVGPTGTLAADAAGDLWMMTVRGQNGVLLERKAHGGWATHRTGLTSARLPCCPTTAPKSIVMGPNGNPWFTALYWLKPKVYTGVFGTTAPSGTTLFPISQRGLKLTVYASGIAATSTHVWFTGDDPFQVNGALWRVNAGGTQTVYPIPYNPIALAADGHGNLWFTAGAFGNASQIVEAIPSN
jgi:streptogramin lyase